MKISFFQKSLFLFVGFILLLLFSAICLAESQPKAWNLSQENPFFVGREDHLEAIHDFFKRDDRRVLALTGGPGFGKTQIAKRFAQKYAGDYDFIWWFDAQQDLSSQFERLTIALNILLPKKEKIIASTMSKEALIDTVKNVLRLRQIKYLFIFDNAEEYGKIEKFIPYAHQKFRKNILLTSRNANIWTDKIEIGEFKRQESLHLIRAALPQEKSEDMEKLAEVLSDYPLGLSIAVGFIKSHLTTNISKYTDIHIKKILSQEGKISSTLLDSYTNDAQTTLSISLKAIKDDSISALETLFFMSLLNSKDIPEAYIDLWLKKIKSSLTADEAIKYVYDQSLIDIRKEYEQNGDYKGGKNIMHYLSIHDLTHQLINQKLSAEEKKKLLDTATDVMLEVFSGTSEDLIKTIANEPIHLLHARKLCENARQIDYSSPPLLKLKVCILEILMGFMRDFEAAKVVLEDIEEDQKRGLQLEPYYQALFKINKGFFESVYNVNYDEAIRNMSDGLAILTSLNGYSEECLRALSNLAQYYTLRGEIGKADELLRQGKIIFKHSKSPIYNSFFIYMNCFVLNDQGKFEEALNVLQEIQVYHHLSTEHPTVYNSILHEKIGILLKQQKLEEAEKTIEEYEARIEKFFQGRYKKYLGLGSLLFFKSLLLIYQGIHTPQIIQSLEEAIQLYNDILRGDKKNRYQARTHLALGKAHTFNKDYPKALKAYLFSEEIYDLILKEKKIDDVSELYTELAMLGIKLKDEELTQKYLTAHIDVFGLDHPRTEKILRHLDQSDLIAFNLLN